MSKFSPMRFDVEKFDGRINFGLWQIQVKDVLIQSGLHKALRGKPIPVSISVGDSSKTSMISDKEWDDMDLRAASAIRLSFKKCSCKCAWAINCKRTVGKARAVVPGQGHLKPYLKEQFHTLRMETGTKISDHLSILNGIVSELEAVGVVIDDEDKALRLVLSLPSSYEHMKPILMYGKKTLQFEDDVTSKLISEEKRLDGNIGTSSEGTVLISEDRKKKKNSKKNLICCRCGKPGHVKMNCPDGADSANGSNRSADSVSVRTENSEFF